MSSSSSQQPVSDPPGDENGKTEWVEAFLGRSFFDECLDHPIRRNEKNRYCIDCDLPACQYCITSGPHKVHKILKIYRHVYKDVVSLSSVDKHLDCTHIQPYKCNKRLVIALTPLPHCGPALNNEASCEICSRRLVEPHTYRYCSISCKVTAFERKQSDSDPPFLSLQLQTQKTQQRQEDRKHKRKGHPQRAPLF